MVKVTNFVFVECVCTFVLLSRSNREMDIESMHSTHTHTITKQPTNTHTHSHASTQSARKCGEAETQSRARIHRYYYLKGVWTCVCTSFWVNVPEKFSTDLHNFILLFVLFFRTETTRTRIQTHKHTHARRHTPIDKFKNKDEFNDTTTLLCVLYASLRACISPVYRLWSVLVCE